MKYIGVFKKLYFMHILDIREDPGSDVRHSDANRFPQKNPIQNSRPREKSQNEKTLCKFVRERLRLGGISY